MKVYTYNNKIKLTVHQSQLNITIGDRSFNALFPKFEIDLTKTPKGFFDLMMYILFYGLESIDITKTSIETTGDEKITSYSGGADSTALLFAHDGIPVHIYRVYDYVYGEMQLNAVKNVGAMLINTDFELIRTLYGKPHGFNVGVGYGCLYMPLLHHLGANKLQFGVVFDDLAFNFGNPFSYNNDFTNTRLYKIRETLNRFGIDITLPLAGYSEVLTTQIADFSGIPYTSCHVGIGVRHCNECIKCFRKQGAKGKQLDLTAQPLKKRVHNLLTKYPLKMAAVTVYAIQKAGYGFDMYNNIDVSFCERVNRTITKTFYKDESKYFDWQTPEDLENIKKFVDFINDKRLYRV